MRLLIVIASVALTACRVSGAFTCETSEQCRASTGQGVCEAATGFCTFADADCASGTRYADNAGDDLAGRCTGETTPTDGAMIDAPPFDTSVCPAKFDQTIAAQANAKFWIILDTGNYGVNAQRCLDALPGATHPANVHTAAQATQLAKLVFPGGPAWVFVGVMQDPAATTPIGGWINFDGSAFDATLWSSGPPVEPDDGDGNEANHLQQAAAVSYQYQVGDYAHVQALPLVCACDGVPVAAQAMTYLLDNTWAN